MYVVGELEIGLDFFLSMYHPFFHSFENIYGFFSSKNFHFWLEINYCACNFNFQILFVE